MHRLRDSCVAPECEALTKGGGALRFPITLPLDKARPLTTTLRGCDEVAAFLEIHFHGLKEAGRRNWLSKVIPSSAFCATAFFHRGAARLATRESWLLCID